jgi:hypothetical protein
VNWDGLLSLGSQLYSGANHPGLQTTVGGGPLRGRQGDGGSSAMHSTLIGKVEKANRYARELDRISFEQLAVTFKGDNDTHTVRLDGGAWQCTCHFFESWGSCVHVLALQKILGVMLPETAQTSIFSAQPAVPA